MQHTTLLAGIALLSTAAFHSLSLAAEPAPEGVFYIKAQHSGKCVHQQGGSMADGAAVTQWDCVNQPNVHLEKVPTGSGYFLLRFQHSGKCLSVKGAGRSNDTPIIQQTCEYDGPIHQTWSQLPGEGKYVKLQSSLGLCLHQHGATTRNGDAITGWECVDQANVRWEMLPLAPTLPVSPPQTMIEKKCQDYADSAIDQFNRKTALEQANRIDCQLGPNARWQNNRDNHYGWCVANKANDTLMQAETAARKQELNRCYDKLIR